MITDEQARSAAKSIAAIDLMDYPESVRSVLHWACRALASREHPDDGPITADWCQQHGARHRQAVDDYCWDLCGVQVCVEIDPDQVKVTVDSKVWRCDVDTSRLLALLATLRGELSGGPGQLPNIGPQRAADLEKAGRRSNPAAGCVLRHGA